jgi:hypothetical protein
MKHYFKYIIFAIALFSFASCSKDDELSILDGTTWTHKLNENYILPVGEDSSVEHYFLLSFEDGRFVMTLVDNNLITISTLHYGVYTKYNGNKRDNEYLLTSDKSRDDYTSVFELDESGLKMYSESGTYYKLSNIFQE